MLTRCLSNAYAVMLMLSLNKNLYFPNANQLTTKSLQLKKGMLYAIKLT